MNKREVVWLIVRLIGTYFAYLAVITLFTLASSVYGLYALSGDSNAKTDIENGRPAAGFPSPGKTENETHPPVKLDPVGEKLKSETFKTILFYLLLTGIYGGLGFYLIAKGGFLFRILNNEASAKRRKEETVTTLKL